MHSHRHVWTIVQALARRGMSQLDEGDRACKADDAAREGEEWTVRGLTSQDDVERSDSIFTYEHKAYEDIETRMMIKIHRQGMTIMITTCQPLLPRTNARIACWYPGGRPSVRAASRSRARVPPRVHTSCATSTTTRLASLWIISE